jgi:hypothetical protein
MPALSRTPIHPGTACPELFLLKPDFTSSEPELRGLKQASLDSGTANAAFQQKH